MVCSGGSAHGQTVTPSATRPRSWSTARGRGQGWVVVSRPDRSTPAAAAGAPPATAANSARLTRAPAAAKYPADRRPRAAIPEHPLARITSSRESANGRRPWGNNRHGGQSSGAGSDLAMGTLRRSPSIRDAVGRRSRGLARRSTSSCRCRAARKSSVRLRRRAAICRSTLTPTCRGFSGGWSRRRSRCRAWRGGSGDCGRTSPSARNRDRSIC